MIYHLPDAALTSSKGLVHWEGPLINSKSNLLSPYQNSKILKINQKLIYKNFLFA